MNTYGVYVHIPFCLQKCNYCSFVSYPIGSVGKQLVSRYVRDLEKERYLLEEELALGFASSTPTSLYFGGGTPTCMPRLELLSMVEHITGACGLRDPNLHAEITVEANPGTVDLSLLSALKELGVNRISLGIQSFCDDLLRFLGRVHTVQEALQTVESARTAGFSNLSIDLIFGIPGQTLEQWEDTLRMAVSLSPEHISAYELSAEEGTPLHGMLVEGDLNWPQEETVVELWQVTEEFLCSQGYQHYEVSNYALPGYQCKHNMNYWQCGNYLGLGAGAHSHLNGVRWWNTGDLLEYCTRVEEGRSPLAGMEHLSPTEQTTEKLMLGLRTSEGIDVSGMPVTLDWWQTAHDLASQGLLVIQGTRIKPTSKGMLMNSYLARVLTE
ncbi:MAG: radical SAM family heme chaperone HemW [Bacillota bacterium]